MSDALNYLISTRPEAMTAYFTFIKEGGKSLDPKTRALITVLTKIATQTEGGFRQYLPRALQAGWSANEILDAILHAFPALGFTKIVWAVDILLEMDIPEFRPENMGVEKHWHEIKPVGEIPEAKAIRCDVDDRSVFVYRTKDDFRVYDSRCPHQSTNIPHLALSGARLTCPKHEWVFDIESGACIEKGDRPLRRFESKVENGALWAQW